MTTHFSQSLNSGLDSPFGSLLGLANGGYQLSTSAIANTPTDGTTISYDMADLVIALSGGGITTGSGAPSVTVWILPAIDGSNYPNPPGATAQAAPVGLSYTFQQVPGVATTLIACPNIPIPPYNFKVMIQNNLGVALPSSGSAVCALQRKTVANW
ncbi:hypothetical protein [Rhodopila sp.]|uniref:hypothetical protein n=1 Tax=Rhodopila sp. TaxID=2480087 RepID=UPI003D145B0D